ncbi:MAG: hypothetical protein HC817_15770 [Saprospiraceae bacterium]|nr:hypothetical protein [Saprospiraceae bacterium]
MATTPSVFSRRSAPLHPPRFAFFAYKYYFKPPLEDDAQGEVVAFFKQNPPIFEEKKLLSHTELTLSAAGDLMPYEWIQPAFCPHLWDDIATDFLMPIFVLLTSKHRLTHQNLLRSCLK